MVMHCYLGIFELSLMRWTLTFPPENVLIPVIFISFNKQPWPSMRAEGSWLREDSVNINYWRWVCHTLPKWADEMSTQPGGTWTFSLSPALGSLSSHTEENNFTQTFNSNPYKPFEFDLKSTFKVSVINWHYWKTVYNMKAALHHC